MQYTRIRDLREDHDLNQTQVAAILGMSQTGYSKYETGENDIPTTVLIKLARYYQTSIDYLLGEIKDPKRYPRCPLSGESKKKRHLLMQVPFLVGEAGFEPAKSWTTDLQSAPFGRSGIPPYSFTDLMSIA